VPSGNLGNRTETTEGPTALASHPLPDPSGAMPIPNRGSFDDVDSSSDEDGARNPPPLPRESFEDGETMTKFFTQRAAATPEGAYWTAHILVPAHATVPLTFFTTFCAATPSCTDSACPVGAACEASRKS
jgi:hypothetical protein